MADVYIEAVSDADKRPEEIHRFLIHTADGCRLQTVEEKRYTRGIAHWVQHCDLMAACLGGLLLACQLPPLRRRLAMQGSSTCMSGQSCSSAMTAIPGGCSAVLLK